MIKYEKLLDILDKKGLNKSYLRMHGVNPTQLNKLITNGQTKGIENKLCTLLNCQPGDFLEFVPDNDESNED